jgi:hypothetical protein
MWLWTAQILTRRLAARSNCSIQRIDSLPVSITDDAVMMQPGQVLTRTSQRRPVARGLRRVGWKP